MSWEYLYLPLPVSPGGRIRATTSKIPDHVVIMAVVVGASLGSTDQVGEFDRISDEEHGDVVADDVVVTFGGIELDRKPAGVAQGIGAAALAGIAGYPNECLGGGAGLKHRRSGIGAYIIGHFEAAKGASPLACG